MNGEAMTSSFSLEGRSELQHMLSDTELADQQSYSGVGCEYRHVEGRAEMEEEEEEAGGLRAGPKSWEGGSALTGSGAGPEAGLELLEAGELSCDAESEDGPEVKKVGRGSRRKRHYWNRVARGLVWGCGWDLSIMDGFCVDGVVVGVSGRHGIVLMDGDHQELHVRKFKEGVCTDGKHSCLVCDYLWPLQFTILLH